MEHLAGTGLGASVFQVVSCELISEGGTGKPMTHTAALSYGAMHGTILSPMLYDIYMEFICDAVLRFTESIIC